MNGFWYDKANRSFPPGRPFPPSAFFSEGSAPRELTLRPAREEDVPFLTAACSQAIAAGNGTRGTERVTEENRRTFLAAHSGPRHPLFLALRTGKRRADHLTLENF